MHFAGLRTLVKRADAAGQSANSNTSSTLRDSDTQSSSDVYALAVQTAGAHRPAGNVEATITDKCNTTDVHRLGSSPDAHVVGATCATSSAAVSHTHSGDATSPAVVAVSCTNNDRTELPSTSPQAALFTEASSKETVSGTGMAVVLSTTGAPSEQMIASNASTLATHKRSRSSSPVSSSALPLLTKKQFDEQHARAMGALQAAMHAMAQSWAEATMPTVAPGTAQIPSDAHVLSRNELGVPQTLQSHLQRTLRSAMTDGGVNVMDAMRRTERALLDALTEEQANTPTATMLPGVAHASTSETSCDSPDVDDASTTHASSERVALQRQDTSCALATSPVELQELRLLIRALWFVLASHWLSALQAQCVWGYAIYLRERGESEDDSLLSCQLSHADRHAIALALETWHTAARTRACAMELLSYLCDDYETLRQNYEKLQQQGKLEQSANGHKQVNQRVRQVSSEQASKFDECCTVPSDLRHSLYEMMVKYVQRARNFQAARQVYVDITFGNANWKLGLFSAGEVHMRRSIARVERNRIAHILNNERALRLLHAVRDLVNHAEKGLESAQKDMFFTSKLCE